MLFIKKLHKEIACCIVFVLLISTNAYANTGDIWKGEINKGNIANIILHDKSSLFDIIRNVNNYSYEIDGNLYLVKDANDVFLNSPNVAIDIIYSSIKSTKISTGKVAATIVGMESVNIPDTYIGTVPILPTLVNAKLSDGTTKQVTIKWNEAATDIATYKNAGYISISGIIEKYGNYPVSATVLVKEKLLKPQPPAQITASSVTSDEIKVQWITVTGVDGYYVYYSSQSDGTYTPLHYSDGSKQMFVGMDVCFAFLNKLSPNTTVYFKIVSVKNGIESDFSNVVSATTQGIKPNAPTNLVAILSPSKITLKWDLVLDADYYYIYTCYNNYDGQYFPLLDVNGNKNKFYTYQQYSYDHLTSSTSIYYKVTSVKDGTESDYSNIAHASTH